MAPYPQTPLVLRPSSAAAAGAVTISTPQTHARPPKVPARVPLWTRLPALRTMTATVAGTQAQTQGTPLAHAHGSNVIGAGVGSPVPPSIVLPDRVGTTRILLSDTQACVQKLSARMDALGVRSEQALKEVQLAREALDAGGEKTVAEITDVVYKCHAALVKSIETQGNIPDKDKDKITQLTMLSDALLKLYEAQATSLATLTQSSNSHTSALQSLQAQHTQLISTLAPLEPLGRAIPLHIESALATHLSRITDALAPALERAIERGVEGVLARLPLGAYMLDQNDQEQQTARGQKRKRTLEEDVPSIDVARARRSSMAVPSSGAQKDREPPSPLLHRQRSDIWNAARLRSRGSLRRMPTEAAPASSANLEIADETPTPAPPPKALALSRRTTRQTTLPAVNASAVAGPAFKRSRTRSVTHIASAVKGAAGINVDNDAAAQPEGSMDLDNASSSIAVGTSTSVALAPVPIRNTRSAIVMSLQTCTAVPIRAPLEPRQSMRLSIDRGPGEGDNKGSGIQALPTPDAGSENVGPTHAATDSAAGSKAKNKSRSAKSKSKAPKAKGSGTGKRKGKKVAAPPEANPVSASQGAPLDTAMQPVEIGATSSNRVPGTNSKEASKETSPKRTTTGASDTSLVSAASVHGPPNSPSAHVESSLIPLSDLDGNGDSNGRAPRDALTSIPAVQNTTSSVRSLIDLMSTSPDSTPPTRDGEGEGASLAAALAHVDCDIDFASGSGMDTDIKQQEEEDAKSEPGDIAFFSGVPQGTGSAPAGTGVLFNQHSGRPRRILFVDDNDSPGIDLWFDELPDE